MGYPDLSGGISSGAHGHKLPQDRGAAASRHGGDFTGVALSVSMVLPDDASFQRQFLFYMERTVDQCVWDSAGSGGECGAVREKLM